MEFPRPYAEMGQRMTIIISSYYICCMSAYKCNSGFVIYRIVFEARTVLESELENDLCTEDHTSMDDSSFLPSFSKKPSPFATSKTMFENSETVKQGKYVVIISSYVVINLHAHIIYKR